MQESFGYCSACTALRLSFIFPSRFHHSKEARSGQEAGGSEKRHGTHGHDTQPWQLTQTDQRDTPYHMTSHWVINAGRGGFSLAGGHSPGTSWASVCLCVTFPRSHPFPLFIKLSSSQAMGFLTFALPSLSLWCPWVGGEVIEWLDGVNSRRSHSRRSKDGICMVSRFQITIAMDSYIFNPLFTFCLCVL